MRCHVVDFLGKLTERTKTPEGFLVAPVRLSRADNVQVYLARELGLDEDGVPPGKQVRLFRPSSEVFSQASLDSLSNKTITLDHPPEGVSVENWKEVAAGDVSVVTAGGDHTRSVATIKHKDAIRAIEEDGTVEMSVGYDFDLDMTAGTTPSGEEYDGVQRNIRGNHHAIVDRARGGRGCRIADRQPDRQPQEKKTMKIKMADRAIAGITLPGFAVTVDDAAGETAQDSLDRHLRACDDAVKAFDALTVDRDGHKKRADDAEKALAEAKTAHDTKVKELTGKILAEDAVSALVRDHASAMDAVKVLGSDDLREKIGTFKTAREMRAALVGDVMENLESLKPVALRVLEAGGETDPTKATDSALKMVIASLLPLHSAEDTAGDDGASSMAHDRNRALAGGDDAGTNANDGVKMDAVSRARQYDMLRSRGQHDAAKRLMEKDC